MWAWDPRPAEASWTSIPMSPPKSSAKPASGAENARPTARAAPFFWKIKKAYITRDLCIGCAECIVRCPTGSISINWNQTIPVFMEKMVEYAAGVLKNKQKKALFINFITDIAPKCDCLPYTESPIVNNIGVVASLDPVAIDQASVDLVNQQPGLPHTALKTCLAPGEDKFKGLYPDVDWSHQLAYAEQIGLGTREYKLVKLKTLAYKKS
jgi:uncharacterized protein